MQKETSFPQKQKPLEFYFRGLFHFLFREIYSSGASSSTNSTLASFLISTVSSASSISVESSASVSSMSLSIFNIFSYPTTLPSPLLHANIIPSKVSNEFYDLFSILAITASEDSLLKSPKQLAGSRGCLVSIPLLPNFPGKEGN